MLRTTIIPVCDPEKQIKQVNNTEELFTAITLFWERLRAKRPACFNIAKSNFIRYCNAKWTHEKQNENFIHTIKILNEDKKLTVLLNDVLKDSSTIRNILKNEYLDDMDALLSALIPKPSSPPFPGITLNTGINLAETKNIQGKHESREEMAERGDPVEEYNLAKEYVHGIRRNKDLNLAFYWCQRSAKHGYRKAQYRLAICFHIGEGVEKNLKEAVYWYTFAAKQHHLGAQYSLADLLYKGRNGVTKDINAAVHWYKCAAVLGEVNCQYNYALLLLHGEGVEKDLESALLWCERSIESGYTRAADLLAEINKQLKLNRPGL